MLVALNVALSAILVLLTLASWKLWKGAWGQWLIRLAPYLSSLGALLLLAYYLLTLDARWTLVISVALLLNRFNQYAQRREMRQQR